MTCLVTIALIALSVVVPGTSNENPDGDMLNSATVEIDEGEKIRENGN